MLAAPYFVCDVPSTVVPDCEFYVDAGNLESNYSDSTLDPFSASKAVCFRCKKGYQGTFDEASAVTYSALLGTVQINGFSACDTPIVGCEFFKKHFGFGYLPNSLRVHDADIFKK